MAIRCTNQSFRLVVQKFSALHREDGHLKETFPVLLEYEVTALPNPSLNNHVAIKAIEENELGCSTNHVTIGF